MSERNNQKLPLSAAQLAVWRDLLLHPNDVSYSIWGCVRIDGAPDIERLGKSIEHVCTKSPNFRLRFEGGVHDVMQVFAPSVSAEVSILDFSSMPDPEVAAMEWMRLDHDRPFDLRVGTLFRNALLRISSDSIFWYRNYHHLIIDGFSMIVLGQRVAEMYKSLDQQSGNDCAPERSYGDYGDYVRSEAIYRSSARHEADKKYWTSLYAELPRPVSLSVRSVRSSSGSRRVQVSNAWLPHDLLERCYSLAAASHLNAGQLLISLIALYIHHVTGEHDIPLCMPTHGRVTKAGMETLGMCTNILPMRFQFDSNFTVNQAIKHVADRVAEGLRHSRYRFAELHSDLGLNRGETLPFRIHANVVRTGEQLKITDKPVVVRAMSTGPVDDLSLMVVENRANRGHFRLGVTFNPALYEEWEIDLHKQYFQRLLESVVANPELKLREIDLVSTDERHRLLSLWNETSRQWPSEKCFHRLFQEQASATPNAIAVIYKGTRITYSELDAKSNQLAHYLRAAGVRHGEIVGVCLDRSPDAIVAFIAIQKAVAAYLPLEPDVPEARLTYMATDANVRYIVTHSDHELRLPDHLARLIFVDTMAAAIAAEATTPLDLMMNPTDLAYVIYTSGSTGQPKGVLLQHDSLCNIAYALAELLGVGPSVRLLQFAKLSFDVSIGEIATALVSGGTLVLADRMDLLPGNLGRTMIENDIEVVTLPPAILHSLRDDAFPNLKTLAVGGDSCPVDLAAEWSRRCRLINVYGPTETTVWSTAGQCDGGETVSIGCPLANTTVYILDAHRKPVPIGIPGELCIGGIGVARGYLNRPELTQERFIPNPFASDGQSRLYRTGDLARYLPDGRLEFLGRKDQQIKIRGFRVELGEIEAALASHEAVVEGAVVVREISSRKQIVAYAVRKAGYEHTESGELRAALRARLPEYMIPVAVMFMETMPRTPSGKLDRKAFPALDASLLDRPYVAPTTATEISLTKIWSEALDTERVGASDNFFDIGGDSLAALNVLALVFGRFGIELAPQDIYETANLSELSVRIDKCLSRTGREIEEQASA